MDFTAIFEFIKTGQPERVAWLVVAFLVFCGIVGTFAYYTIDSILSFLRKLFPLFTINRKDRIVEVPKYVTPPDNKEIDQYLTILKRIANDYNNNMKLQ